MEATYDAVFARLNSLSDKSKDSVSAELSKIEDEFDKYIEKLITQNEYFSGIAQLNFELKSRHDIIVNTIVPQQIEEVAVPEVEELKVEKVSEPVVEPVIEPVEVEAESTIIRPKASKPKVKEVEL